MSARLLFVCQGNTCRSLIAEFIARELCGKMIESTSAGFEPQKVGDAANAIDCLKDHFGIDASTHVPKDVGLLDVKVYDYVIVMDRRIAIRFKGKYPAYPDERLIRWKIKDPWGNVDEYKPCALSIIKELRRLRSKIVGPSNSSRG